MDISQAEPSMDTAEKSSDRPKVYLFENGKGDLFMSLSYKSAEQEDTMMGGYSRGRSVERRYVYGRMPLVEKGV